MPIDSKRVQAIFLAAVEQADRAAILDRECGDDLELRRRVEALLRANDEPASYLDEPAVELAKPNGTIDEPPITERPGSMIGPYKLKEQIGEGGFGLVFVAEQQEPVKRKVALKVIKPGMDTREVMARFTAERQALALMDHPNIARVLDAGATDSGRPYFVMELVRGIPITEYCDQNQLSPRDRLELFVAVCQAVQHAHQKGIIHRDIKPSNVLVTSHDGKPVAKVIDFGVAKAINQQLTERSIYTNFTQMIGTPLYMSPEQAEMSGLDIDTRSDIYSLGVLLYELLTGTTPLEKKQFAKAAYDEIRRMIREEEPQKPSTRLSTSDSIASIAAQRHTEPAKLSKLMRGDLDWITMKALEKDRTRRYESANGLARDVQRYLDDEPVEACPPSTTYRLRKFAKKNRAALTTAAVISLFLVAGAAVSAWQAVRATKAERNAVVLAEVETQQRREAEQQRDRAVQAERAAKETKKWADDEAAIAQACLGYLRSDLFGLADPWTGDDPERARDKDVKLISVVDHAAKGIGGRFPEQPLVEAAVRQTIGATYQGLGKFKLAREQLERALEIRRRVFGDDASETLSVMADLAIVYRELESYPQAIELLGHVIEVSRRAGVGDSPEVLWATHNLGEVYLRQGRDQEGEKLLNAALAGWRRRGAEGARPSLYVLAVILDRYSDRGEHDRVAGILPDALERSSRLLGPDHPITIRLAFCESRLSAHRGQLTEALAQYVALLRIARRTFGDDHPVTKKIEGYLGGVYIRLGKPREAEALWRHKLESDRRVLGNDHPFTIRSIEVIGELLANEGNFVGAEPLLRESTALREKAQPDAWTTFHAESMLGGALLGQKKYDEAEPILISGLEGMRRREKTMPEEGKAHIREAIEHLVHLYEALAKNDEAARWRMELQAFKAVRKPEGKP